MAVVNVQKNGNAPAGLKYGDTVKTAGGSYTIVAPGTPGSKYNPASGYSSIKVSEPQSSSNSTSQAIASAVSQSKANSEMSQANAREQMDFQTSSNAKAMSFSAEEAEKNREWQEKMSNTAHQREVQDLIKAGLNPVLSANYGGSSTPAGSSAYGVTSGGSQGQVDTSANSVVASLLTAVINQATALQTTSMSNLTALQTTEIGANAMLGSANINAKSNQYIQTLKNEFEEYLRKNYPADKYNFINSILDNFAEWIGYRTGSAKGIKDIIEFFNNLKQ